MKNKLNKKKKKSSDSVFDRNGNDVRKLRNSYVLRNSQEEKLLSLDIGRECGRSANT
jgi:hypothetical protein